MHRNDRPKLATSTMKPQHLSLVPGEPKQIVCPDCRRWALIKKAKVFPHSSRGRARCPGSGQRLLMDRDPGEWARQLRHGISKDAPWPGQLRTTGKPRHSNPYGHIADPEPPLYGDVNPDPPVNGRGEKLLPKATRL